LSAHGIKSIHSLPGVGENLHSHPLIFISTEVSAGLTDKHAFESDPSAIAEARTLWIADKSGPLGHHNGTVWGGFLKLAALEQSHEFKALDPSLREYLCSPAVPAFELTGNQFRTPLGSTLPAESSYLSYAGILVSAQSVGNMTLASSNAKDAPIVDPKYLDHPYDRRAMLEIVKEMMRFQQHSGLSRYFKQYLVGPNSAGEEEIQVRSLFAMESYIKLRLTL
jgi:choline dehydrogenase-like flavoprotein